MWPKSPTRRRASSGGSGVSAATVAPHRPSADRHKPQLAGRTPLLGFRQIAGITLPPVRDNLRQHNNLCRRDFGDGNRVIQLTARPGVPGRTDVYGTLAGKSALPGPVVSR